MNYQLKLVLSFLIFLLLVISSCKKEPPEIPANNYVLFPVGQKSIDINNIRVEADSVINEYFVMNDQYGGRWIKLAFNKLNLNSVVRMKFNIKPKPLILTEQETPVPDIWFKPSLYIDSHHPSIIEKANHLTNGISGVDNKARNIQLFVWDYLDLKIYKDCGIVPASETLKMQYGVCINFARLFVALCRATGIPARTIWGALNTGGGMYNGHHNWAEFLGEDNKWHPVGLTFTNDFDLNDLRFLDLLYAPEENIHLEEYKMFTISSDGDYYFYDGSGSAVDGRLGIQTLSDNFPDEMELSMDFPIIDLFN